MVKTQKNLIVFYSHEGNIHAITYHIQSVLGADVYEIKLKTPYPEDNREFVKVVKTELAENVGHEIEKNALKIDYYDNVFIGSANWGTTITPAMKQFLLENDLSNVTIYPFFSHGGTGIGHMFEDIKEFSNCPSIKEPLLVYQMALTDDQLFEWLKK